MTDRVSGLDYNPSYRIVLAVHILTKNIIMH